MNVNLKSTGSGTLSAAHPQAQPGPTPSGAIIYTITNVPDGTPLADVLNQARHAIFLRSPSEPIHWDEIGVGRIVR